MTLKNIRIFTYGTLMFPDIVKRLLLHKDFTIKNATLDGFIKFRGNGEWLNVLKVGKGEKLDGKVVTVNHTDDLREFDRFESVASGLYYRRNIFYTL